MSNDAENGGIRKPALFFMPGLSSLKVNLMPQIPAAREAYGMPNSELVALIDEKNAFEAFRADKQLQQRYFGAQNGPRDEEEMESAFRHWYGIREIRLAREAGGRLGKTNAEKIWHYNVLERHVLRMIKERKIVLTDEGFTDVSGPEPVLLLPYRGEEAVEGLTPGALRNLYLSVSPYQRAIKEAYSRLGMAKMLYYGDWSVNRVDSVSEGLGITSLQDVETAVLKFKDRHGLIDHNSNEKLVGFHVGCGNGILPETMRRKSDTLPFPEKNLKRLKDYFMEIGFADQIYHTINDLLSHFVRKELALREGDDNPDEKDIQKTERRAVAEFISFISTELMRRIFHLKKFPQKTGSAGKRDLKEANDKLVRLSGNPDAVKDILLNMGRHVRVVNKKGEAKREYKADGEYLSDERREISEPCRRLIERLYADGGRTTREKLAEIFNPGLLDENTLLAGHIQMWAHRVILGRFENLAQIFPENDHGQAPEIIDVAHSYKGDAHLQDQPFKELFYGIAQRLKPGGVYITDGLKEAYTRQHRWQELLGISKKMLEQLAKDGKYFRGEVIADGRGARSVMIQRGILKGYTPEGEPVVEYFNQAEKKSFLRTYEGIHRRKNCHFEPLEQFADNWPVEVIRSEMIRRLELILIDRALQKDEDQETMANKLYDGRLEFQELHGDVDSVISQKYARDNRDELRKARSNDAAWEKLCNGLFNEIVKRSKYIRDKIFAIQKGAVPKREVTVITWPPSSQRHEGIGKMRSMPQSLLPRNDNIPSRRVMEEVEGVRMISCIKALRRLIGRPPIHLLQFDNCFSNPLTEATFRELLRGLNFEDYVNIRNVRLNRKYDFESAASGKGKAYEELQCQMKQDFESLLESQGAGIVVIGGSMNNVYDFSGHAFTKYYSERLLNRVKNGAPLRVIGICFGNQTLITAIGAHVFFNKADYRTDKGALQIGPSRIRFRAMGDEQSLLFLGSKDVTMPLARSGYVVTPQEYGMERNLTPLAWEVDEHGQIDPDLPPVAFSMFGGKVLTMQPHVDIDITNPAHLGVVRKHIFRKFEEYRRNFDIDETQRMVTWRRPTPNTLYRNFELNGVNPAGETVPWIERDAGQAFLMPAIRKHAESLILGYQAGVY